jgi:hypothetical protein
MRQRTFIHFACCILWRGMSTIFHKRQRISGLAEGLSASILSSITNKMQRYTVFFIAVNALHVSGGFSAHHQELKTVHTAAGICQACLLRPLASGTCQTRLLLPLAVAATKLDIYQMLCVQFRAPDDRRRNRLKHVDH